MVEQIVVSYKVERPVVKEALHMLYHNRACYKGMTQLLHNILLLICHPVRVCRVYGREIGILKLILYAIYSNSAILIVYIVEQQSVIHLKLRVPADNPALQFKLYYGYCLMHLGYKAQLAAVHILIL